MYEVPLEISNVPQFGNCRKVYQTQFNYLFLIELYSDVISILFHEKKHPQNMTNNYISFQSEVYLANMIFRINCHLQFRMHIRNEVLFHLKCE